MWTCWSPADDRRAVDLRNGGATDAAIAADLGRTESAVQSRLSLLRSRGEAMMSLMRVSWSEDSIVAVIGMLDDGKTFAAIARALGINRETVRANVELLRAEGRVADPDEDAVITVPAGDPLLAALHLEYARRSA